MSIRLEDVTLNYETNGGIKVNAINKINLSIEEGEFIGIMGKTGCGKSSLIQLMAGLIIPTEGKIKLYDEDINLKKYDRNNLRTSIGLVFQYPEYQLFESTVEKDVAFGLKYSNLNKEDRINAIKWSIELMGFDFDKVRNKSPLSFSGGEKRRLAIAGVLVRKPKILMFDEPIAGLDPKSRESFLELLKKLHNDGVTIIMISHNMDALAEYTKRVIAMDKGKIIFDNSTKNVFSNYDKLKEFGLSSSLSRILVDMLNKNGFEISKSIVKYDELLCEIENKYLRK